MLKFVPAALAIAALSVSAAPAMAKGNWEYNGQRYETRSQCLKAKKRAQKRGTVIGAVAAGGVAAIAGGNLGESALAAGAGALIGNQVGKATKKC